jgi:hypothetical protein
VSRGRGNQRWVTLAEFEAEDSRRGDCRGEQCDYGVHWYDNEDPVGRLTHIALTGEVVTVAHHNGPVELLATIPSEHRVETLLADYGYVCLFPP